MQISSRFTIAVHVLVCIETFKNDYKVTSDFLALSVNCKCCAGQRWYKCGKTP